MSYVAPAVVCPAVAPASARPGEVGSAIVSGLYGWGEITILRHLFLLQLSMHEFLHVFFSEVQLGQVSIVEQLLFTFPIARYSADGQL